MTSPSGPSRRGFGLALVGGAAAWLPAVGRAQQPPTADHGGIKPAVPVPEMKLLRHDRVDTTFVELLHGRVTAVQLMFTSCTTTCPIQGAIFARVQKLIPDQVKRGIQLVSLSVDPEHDTPPVLKAWLRRFKSRPGWLAAAPATADVERLRAFSGGGRSASDNHSTRIQMFSRQSELVWRTGELPDAEEIASILAKL